MTHLIRQPFRRMASLSSSLVVATLVLGAGAMLNGCGKEEEKPKEAKRTKTQYTPKVVQIRTIEELRAELNIDDRVDMPEDKAPTSEMERIALLKFFDAWVRGNPDNVLEVLGMADHAQLQAMIDEGQWQQVTGDAIEFVTIQVGPSKEGDTCVLAYYEGAEMTQAQLWRYRNDGETIMFEAVATPPGMVDRLSGDDLIAGWWKILDEENAMWDLDDNDQLGDLIAEDEAKEDSASGSDGRRKPGGGDGRRKPGGGRRVPGGR